MERPQEGLGLALAQDDAPMGLADEARVAGVVEEGEEGLEVAVDVEQADRLLVVSELRPGGGLEELVEGAEAARQDHVRIREPAHHGLSRVHGVDDDELREARVRDLVADEARRDHAHHAPARGERRVGDESHEAAIAPAVDHLDAPAREEPADGRRGVTVARGAGIARAAIDGDAPNRPHGRRIPRLAALCGVVLAIGCGPPRKAPASELGASLAECVAPSPDLPPASQLDARETAIGARFDRERAQALVAKLDARVRLRGNRSYEASLEDARARLLEAGFAVEDVEARALGPERETWSPVAGELVLLGDGTERDVTLHAFDDEGDRDRLLVMPGSDSIEGVFELARPGDARAAGADAARVLFGRMPARALYEAARRDGATGIVSFHVHPVARGHADAIGFQYLPDATGRAFGLSISEGAARAIEARLARGPARVRVRAVTVRGRGRATTLIARVRGDDPRRAPIAFFAHVDEPGAVDDASGVGALIELAVAVRRALDEGAIARPERDLLFMVGQELESVPRYLAAAGRRPAAALVLDMVGADPALGAELLVERMPDPSVRRRLSPDAPSGWGEPATVPSAARPNGLDAYVALALARSDVRGPSLPYRSHPFEGGSDHVPFLEAGVPAVLVWSFPDDAYHTSRDRLERVSTDRMARVASAVGAAALGLAADPRSAERELAGAIEWAAACRLHHLVAAGERTGIEAFAAHYDEALARMTSPEAIEARRRLADRYREALDCVRSTRERTR